MWEIFGVIFGGGYLAGKIRSEKRASKKHYEKMVLYSDNRKAWEASVINRDIELSISAYVADINNREKVLNTVKSICPILPQDQHNEKNYVRVLLANDGIILEEDVLVGISTPLYLISTSAHRTNMDKRRQFNRYMLWLNETLQRKGVNAQMVFVPPTTSRQTINGYIREDIEAEKPFYEMRELDAVGDLLGIFRWAPQVVSISEGG